jgi:hypothetical protein
MDSVSEVCEGVEEGNVASSQGSVAGGAGPRFGAGMARSHQLSKVKPDAPRVNSHILSRDPSRGK